MAYEVGSGRIFGEKSAAHLIAGIESVYDRLEDNPYQFPESQDDFLASLGYREALMRLFWVS